MVAHGLRLAVPRDARWRFVKLHAYQQLSITFQDVRAFAADVDTFSLEGPGSGCTGLDKFGEALTARGKRWANSGLPNTGGMTAMHSLKDWCEEICAYKGREECMCGACTRCLHRAGVISALPEVHNAAGYVMPGMALFPAHHDDCPSDEYDEGYEQEMGWGEEYEEDYDGEFGEEGPDLGALIEDVMGDADYHH